MESLDEKTALELYEHASLHELGAAAEAECVRRHPQPWRTFVVDRDLQEESLANGRGCFTAFIGWPFQSPNTSLASEGQAGDAILGSVPYLRMLSIFRLFLNKMDNIQVSLLTQGVRVGQAALRYGANDMGGLMMEENVVAATGTRFRITRDDMVNLIRQAGYEPRQRDGFYSLA